MAGSFRATVASARDRYIPALGFDRLTGLYDPIVRVTTRERTFKRRLLDQAAIAFGHRVLDLGSGTGTLAVLAKQREPGAEVVGVDGDPAVIERARRKAAEAGVDVRFDHGLADALPYADASFDRVLSTLLFHHLTHDAKAAAASEVMRVLRPGGEVHLADWGPVRGLVAGTLFLAVRAFDGFEATRDNAEGRLPDILAAAGLADVAERARIRAALGSLSLLSARRPAA